jgi:hypothetical protein
LLDLIERIPKPRFIFPLLRRHPVLISRMKHLAPEVSLIFYPLLTETFCNTKPLNVMALRNSKLLHLLEVLHIGHFTLESLGSSLEFAPFPRQQIPFKRTAPGSALGTTEA